MIGNYKGKMLDVVSRLEDDLQPLEDDLQTTEDDLQTFNGFVCLSQGIDGSADLTPLG